MKDDLDKLIENHKAAVVASHDAWIAMLKAQEVSRAMRDAERESLRKIEEHIYKRVYVQGLGKDFKPAWF